MTGNGYPSGTVAFAFTDVEGSTALLRQLGDGWVPLLRTCQDLVRDAVEQVGGVVVDAEGDGALLAFSDVRSAVAGLLSAQARLLRHPWPADAPVRVRMGVHAGHAEPVDGRYVALAVHEAARVGAVAHGGQLVVSEQAALLLAGALPQGAQLRDRGRFRLRDFALPVRVYDVTAAGVPPVERGLRAVPADGGNLPPAGGPVHGRDELLATLAGTGRLTTVVGPPGVGKTAVALAAARADSASDGVWLVSLEPLPAVRSVGEAVLSALGLPVVGGPDAVAGRMAGLEAVLLLDGADDRIAEVADLVTALWRQAPGVRVLGTSRSALGVEGEHVVRLDPLPVPPDDAAPEDVLSAASVRLLLAGAGRRWDDVRHADALRGLARRADGLPLALDLVGARLGALSPADLLPRVDALLGRAGREGALRLALDSAWSALPDDARRVWERLSVFSGAVGLAAVEEVCADEALPVDEVVDALLALVDGSVVLLEQDAFAHATYRLLRSVRQYGLERLEQAGQAEVWADRHARWAAASAERWLRRAYAEPPPGPLPALAAAQDDLLTGLSRLATRDPDRVLALVLPLRRLLRESLDLVDLVELAESLPDVRGRTAVVALLKAQLSWERAPGPDTLGLFTAAAGAAADADPAVRADVLVQLVLAREQFDLPPDLDRDADLARAAVESGDPTLVVRATALQVHGSTRLAAQLDGAVELAERQAPGLLPWARSRRLHLWAGDRPEQARADVDSLLLVTPLVGASESTAGLLMAAMALLALGEPEQAGRLADQVSAAASRRRNVVIGYHAAAMRAAAAGALAEPRAARRLAELEGTRIGPTGWHNPVVVAYARGWVLAGADRVAARAWASAGPPDDRILGWQLRALAAAVRDPSWEPGAGLLGHLEPA